MLKVDKATTAHAEKGKEHAEAVEKFGTISFWAFDRVLLFLLFLFRDLTTFFQWFQ